VSFGVAAERAVVRNTADCGDLSLPGEKRPTILADTLAERGR
jgi:hypothetical protein